MRIVCLMNFKYKENINTFLRLAMILLGIFFAPNAMCEEADDQEAFTINNIEVYAEAENLPDAKEKAIEIGSGIALEKLLDNFVLFKERQRSKSIISHTNPYELINSYDVVSERMTSHSYKATVNYKFNYKKIRNFLYSSGIKYTGRMTENVLLVPVLNTKDGNLFIWQNKIWRDAWDQIPKKVGLISYTLTVEDLVNIESINTKDIIVAPFEKYERLVSSYKTSTLGVIFATELDNKLDIIVRFLNVTHNYYRFATYEYKPKEDKNEFYRRVANDIAAKIDADWKGNKVFEQERYYSSKLKVKFNQPTEWVKLKQDLEKIKEIVQIKLLSKSAKDAEVEIIYILPPIIFTRELAYYGYVIKQENREIFLTANKKL